ncbi:MAG: glycogen/starch synthase [Bacteroidales bacterium]|jgi:starch synthase|nr:glycogen/starch synthase [Bacteroidales bacterium]MDY0253483.1 glycogen/starch synthase [Tenuifilaceae bacterium]
MKSVKVLFVSQEITPYLDENEMSLIGRNLPQGIQEKGREIRTFMPRWGCINERRNQLHEVIRLSGMNLVINDADHPLIIKVASIQSARMQVYFIDNEDYFQRKATLTDEKGNYYPDNDERAIFFARGVMETVKKLRWAPDIVHCHGWFSSMIPILVKQTYREDPIFAKAKVVYSVYNDTFTPALDPQIKSKLQLENITKKDLELLNTPDYTNLTKFALKYSDGIIFGNPKVDPKIDEHIKSLNKPVLDYQGVDDYVEQINLFYDKVLNSTGNDKK